MLGTRHMSGYGFFSDFEIQMHELSWGWDPSLSIEIHWFHMYQIVIQLIKKCELHFDYIFYMRSGVEFPTYDGLLVLKFFKIWSL